MSRPRPEFVMPLAAMAVLLAIGIPALRRGEAVLGGSCVAAAAVIAIWLVIAILRGR